LETFSGSQLNKDATLAIYTGSNDTKWSTLGSLSGSFARTNSTNTFNGSQTVSGSLTVTQDLIVLGSSSIQIISSSNLVIGASLVTLNTSTPSSRFAGLQIVDSGSSGGSGSFLYDAVQDELLFIHRGNGANTTSSVLLMGPETYDNLGNEIYLTNNRLPKGTGKEHLVDSNISDDGTTVNITGALTVTGNITGPIRATNGVVSGSSQITYSGLTGIPAGIVSGSSQVVGSSITTNTITIGSTSTALGGTSTTLAGLTSVSSTGFTGALTGNASTATTLQTARTINGTSFNGSTDITIPNLVSGSSQIFAGSTTNFTTDVKTQLNSNTVVSGSGQINVASTTGDIALGTRTSGNYVATITADTGLSSTGAATGEGIGHTLSIAAGGVTNAMLAGSIANDKLTNSSITIAGTSTSLGGTISAATIGNAIGAFSGSSQVNADTITNFDPNVLAYNNSLAVVSGSKVVTIGSTAITLGGTATTIAGLISVSSTGFSGSIASTNGVISGSSQVNADTITNFDPNVLAYNNSLAVVSGSKTISGITLGSNLATLTIGTGLSGTSYNGSTGVTIANTGVTSNVAGTGIGVSGATGAVTITNTGVTSIVAGSAINISGATGAVTITHADTSTAANLSATSRTYVSALTFDTYGHVTAYSTATETVTDTNTVTTNIAGTGISVSSGTGNSTITNTGVTSALAGTGVSVSGATGSVTISIGQSVATSANVQFTTVNAGNFRDGTGTFNVNLGSGGSEGRALVAGYSGNQYGGIGYNVRHTGTNDSFIAPGTDTATYLVFNTGYTFRYAGAGSAGRTLSWTQIGRLDASGNFTIPGNLTAGQVDTGQGATEVHLMNQNVRTTDAVTFATVDTGQGATEVHLMNQNVRTTDSVTFANITGSLSGNATTAGGLAVHNTQGTQNTANQILRTNNSGFTYLGWINTVSGDNGTTAIDRIYASSDSFIRYYTPTNFRTVLNVPTRTGGDASGTWTISITGNAATATTATTTTGNAGTATTLQTARTINGVSFNGSSNITVPSLYDTNYIRITNPGGGEYVTTTTHLTGAIRITFPVAFTNTMLKMTIKVYDYNEGTSFDVNVAGYIYETNGWFSVTANIIGSNNVNRQITVRLGGTTNPIIYIGELNSSWNHPQIMITNLELGYSGQGIGWTTGWTIGFETSAFNNVSRTITNPQIGWATEAATGGALVLRNASGDINSRYSFASYHNSSDDVSTGTISHIMAKFGDNYYRSATAAKVAAFITNQSMNIVGNATTATTASSVAWANISGQRTLTRDNAGLRGDAGASSGFFETSSPTNYYSGATSFQHLIDVRHANITNNYAMQIAGSFFDQQLWFRKTNDSPTTAWRRIMETTDFAFAANMNQNVRTTDAVTFATINTGHGANELYAMNQNVRTTDSVTFAGITETSALKYKENIFSIEDTLDTVLKLRPVKYNIKGEEKVEIGLIAEEVHELIPELIKYNSENEIDSISYTRLAAVLIGAIKEQQIQINKLKEQIEINKK
jgi:hypothetical protein